MERVYIKDIKKGQVFLEGWIHEIRDLAKIKFLLLRDVSGIVQCIIKDEKLMKKFSELSIESVISIQGEAKPAQVKSPEVSRNEIEIEVKDLEIISKAQEPPIQVLEKGITTALPKRLDYRFLDLRKPRNLAIFKVRAEVNKALRDFFYKEGFIEMQTPKIVGMGAEGGATMFKFDYFGKRAYLSQSQQLYKQMLNIAGFDKVYEIGPTFRAEKSHTTRHITEFTHIDVEMSFIKDEDDIYKLQERLLVFILEHVRKTCERELRLLNVNIEIPKIPFPRIKYSEGLKLLEKAGIKSKEIGQEEEVKLGEIIKQKYKTEFYFITKMPVKDVKFYCMQDGDEARYGDLEFKGNEISSGGQREHRYEILIKQIKDQKLNLKDFEYYTEPFKYGVPSHGGFGMGCDRLVQFILNIENIREAVLFPRDTERLMP
jgi:aspartyl-tRNA synthetase